MGERSESEIRERLFKTIRKQRDGMLGLIGSEVQHPQPMTTLIDDDQETPFYFLTRDDTDLARAVAAGANDALYVFQEEGELWASILGSLTISTDRAVVDRFWNPVVAAWYPDGKDDPHIRVLTFTPSDAQVWIQTEGPLRFGWEVAKANVTKQMPDVGQRAELKL